MLRTIKGPAELAPVLPGPLVYRGSKDHGQLARGEVGVLGVVRKRKMSAPGVILGGECGVKVGVGVGAP